jgi:hypothetical protein
MVMPGPCPDKSYVHIAITGLCKQNFSRQILVIAGYHQLSTVSLMVKQKYLCRYFKQGQ